MIGYSCNIHPTQFNEHALSNLVINIAHRVHIWVRLDDFSPPPAWRAPFTIMKTSQIIISLVSPGFVPQLCGIFRNRFLLSSSVETRSNAKRVHYFEVLWHATDQQIKESHTWHWVLYLITSCVLESIILLCRVSTRASLLGFLSRPVPHNRQVPKKITESILGYNVININW